MMMNALAFLTSWSRIVSRSISRRKMIAAAILIVVLWIAFRPSDFANDVQRSGRSVSYVGFSDLNKQPNPNPDPDADSDSDDSKADKDLIPVAEPKSAKNAYPPCFDEQRGVINTADLQDQIPPLRSPRQRAEQPPLDEKAKLQIYVVPHSHTDPGWLETFDGYFNKRVKSILESTIQALKQYESFKFIFAEVSFIDLFLAQADASTRALLTEAIASGRLEVVTGGWVMTDEASAHVYAMLDQLVEGHAFLENLTRGTNSTVKPRTSWSIDPFGYSSTMPYLLRKSGVQNLIINRIHFDLKNYLKKSKQLQFQWRQTFDKAGIHDLLTHVIPSETYDMIDTCGPDKPVCCQFDFLRTEGGPHSCHFWGPNAVEIAADNIRSRAHTLFEQYRKKAAYFRTNSLLVELGGDFRYTDLQEFDKQHRNYRQLFDFLNNDTSLNVHIQWATLSDYFLSLRKELATQGAKLPTLVGDFHVYADNENDYWSGYYTSRPIHKWMSRQLEHHLRTAEQLVAHAMLHSRVLNDAQWQQRAFDELQTVRRGLALFQHHDSLTGTSKAAVMADNWKRLHTAINTAKKLISEMSTKLLYSGRLTGGKGEAEVKEASRAALETDLTYAERPAAAQRTIISVQENGTFIVVYNSLTTRRRTLHQVNVNTAFVGVVSSVSGSFVSAQVEPVWRHPYEVLTDSYKLSFLIDIPPLSFCKFQLVRFANEAEMRSRSLTRLVQIELHNFLVHSNKSSALGKQFSPFKTMLVARDSVEMRNGQVTVNVDGKTGLLRSMKVNRRETRTEFSFITFESFHSGAYLFRPHGQPKPLDANPTSPANHEDPKSSTNSATTYFRVQRGVLADEVNVQVSYVAHSLRFVKADNLVNSGMLEVSNLVDLTKETNVELGFRIETDLETVDDRNESVFHTDQNCFRLTNRRTRSALPVQGNLYPFTCAAFIEDAMTHERLNLLSGQSLAVSSLKPGSIEVILDRRLGQDDGRGLSESVEDNGLAPSSFRIYLSAGKDEQPSASSARVGSSNATLSSKSRQLSVKAYWAMFDLTFPVHSLTATATADASNIPSQLELAESVTTFPCDMHLANVRSSKGPDGRFNVAVFLHRFGIDCHSPIDINIDVDAPTASICSLAMDGKLDVRRLFRAKHERAMTLKSIKRSSLTLLEDSDSVSLQSGEVIIRPFEIEAYKFVWDSK